MSPERDKELVTKYPKIFKNRYADMRTTAMCWGFECSAGWYNIIDKLCSNIQSHINFKRKQRRSNLLFNRALKRALDCGDKSGLYKYFAINGKIDKFALDSTETAIVSGHYKKVTEKIPQVVAEQVKEKFGGLRFYYYGGDEYIEGLVAMAESMSYVTCEVCGSSGNRTNNGYGYISTLCKEHNKNDSNVQDTE